MKRIIAFCLVLILVLASCTSTSTPSPSPAPATLVPRSPTSTIPLLPTWTLSPTPPLKPSPTPRNTSTPVYAGGSSQPGTPAPTPAYPSEELLLDRPSFAVLANPANLVSLTYDPATWMLNTAYPTAYMGYSLTHTSIYNCKLEPTVDRETAGYQVERYNRPLGSATYAITRLSKAGVLEYATYCTGESQDATCYKMTPGDDHAACTAAAEGVLGTFKLIANQFVSPLYSAPNHWLCHDEAGTEGLCQISFSVPLNALSFTSDNQAWAAGDDGLLFQRVGQVWSKADSPTSHPIYDLSFSSPTNGWAVGDGAQVLRWDGVAWKEVLPYHAPGEGPGGSIQMLYGVDARAGQDAWMVGYMKGLDGKLNPYALHWNGTDLVEELDFADCDCGLNSVLILGKDDVLAVGASSQGAISFHWDGSSWSSMLVPGADALYTLAQAPDGAVYAAGKEVARDLSDTRGALFRHTGSSWQRIAVPPITGGVYALAVLPSDQIILGGDFSALRAGLEWQPILAGIAGYGWIVDIETDSQGEVWALTHSGNIFLLKIGG